MRPADAGDPSEVPPHRQERQHASHQDRGAEDADEGEEAAAELPLLGHTQELVLRHHRAHAPAARLGQRTVAHDIGPLPEEEPAAVFQVIGTEATDALVTERGGDLLGHGSGGDAQRAVGLRDERVLRTEPRHQPPLLVAEDDPVGAEGLLHVPDDPVDDLRAKPYAQDAHEAALVVLDRARRRHHYPPLALWPAGIRFHEGQVAPQRTALGEVGPGGGDDEARELGGVGRARGLGARERAGEERLSHLAPPLLPHEATAFRAQPRGLERAPRLQPLPIDHDLAAPLGGQPHPPVLGEAERAALGQGDSGQTRIVEGGGEERRLHRPRVRGIAKAELDLPLDGADEALRSVEVGQDPLADEEGRFAADQLRGGEHRLLRPAGEPPDECAQEGGQAKVGEEEGLRQRQAESGHSAVSTVRVQSG